MKCTPVLALLFLLTVFNISGCGMFYGISDGEFETKFNGIFNTRGDSGILIADIYPLNDYQTRLQYPHSRYIGIDTLISADSTEFILRKKFSCHGGLFDAECSSKKLDIKNTLFIKIIYSDSTSLDTSLPLSGMIKINDFNYKMNILGR